MFQNLTDEGQICSKLVGQLVWRDWSSLSRRTGQSMAGEYICVRLLRSSQQYKNNSYMPHSLPDIDDTYNISPFILLVLVTTF